MINGRDVNVVLSNTGLLQIRNLNSKVMRGSISIWGIATVIGGGPAGPAGPAGADGLSAVSTDDTIDGDGSSAQPLKIAWRDEVRKNTRDSDRLKLATADVIVGESRDPTWGIVNSSGVAGGLARNNADGYWTDARAKAATYTSLPITASGNGDYFVARVPTGSDTRLYAFREVGGFGGTIDEPLNFGRLLGSDNTWDYYVYDVRLFGEVTLRASTHNVGFNIWGGQYRDGSIDIDALTAAVAARLLPSALGTAGQVLTVNEDATAVEWADAGGSEPEPMEETFVLAERRRFDGTGAARAQIFRNVPTDFVKLQVQRNNTSDKAIIESSSITFSYQSFTAGSITIYVRRGRGTTVQIYLASGTSSSNWSNWDVSYVAA